MALDEATRHALHLRLDEVLGPDHAAALMTAYPPIPWADIATKHDLRTEIAILRSDLEAMLHREINGVNGSIAQQTRTIMFAVVGAMMANASLTIGALALTR